MLRSRPGWPVADLELRASRLPADAPEVYVDAYGRSPHRRIEVDHDGRRWVFLFHPDDKPGRTFRGALYQDRAAMPSRYLFRASRRRRVAVLVESPNEPQNAHFPALAARFAATLTHSRRLAELGSPFRRLDYGTRFVAAAEEHEADGPIVKTADLSFVGSVAHADVAGYGLRRRVAAALAERGVPCFGRGIAPFEEKSATLLPFRFSVAMENVREDWYFTEKLIDCWECRTIPVYWGPPCVAEEFDPRGLVTFEALEDLLGLLPTLTAERYEAMRPFAEANLRRARERDVCTGAGLFRRIAAHMDDVLPSGPSRRHGDVSSLARIARAGGPRAIRSAP
ncbi:hypothetical protein [Alienimonas sp. DA493]|uniref:hypothetical protein n=1 Tax=Alienimonas sp. DA493 TaxID=3373605 RepID=UPI0037548179